MEQIFKSLPPKQGYEYIGLLNSDKSIWGYAKDGIFHFCKEDLTEVDRSTTGLDSGVIVLTHEDDNIIQVNESTKFNNFIVIDDSNNILSSKKDESAEQIKGNRSSFFLKRINEKSIIIVTWWDKYVCKSFNKASYATTLVKDPLNTIEWDYHQVIVIDGKLEPDMNIYMFLNGYYFFKIYEEHFCEHRKIHNGKEFVYDGEVPYIWLHKNGKIHLICFCGEYVSGYISLDVLDLENSSFPFHIDVTKYAGKENARLETGNGLCSDNHVIIPLYDKSGCLIIQYYNDQWFSANCIFYERTSGTPIVFKENLLKIEYRNNISDDIEINYYDINGNHLEIPYKEKFVTPFIVRNKNLFNKLEKLYGIIDLRNDEIILPPVFKKINEIDSFNDLYEVVYYNSFGTVNQEFKSLFSAKKGFIVQFGSEYHFPEYINLAVSVRPTNDSFIIYSIGNKDGLIFRGEKVLEPIYDAIEGFGFREESFGKSTNFISYKEIEKRTEEYYPLSVLIHKDRLHGLFIDKDHIIEPQFEMMNCCKVLKENAYFKVQTGDRFGIISDDLDFNERSKVIYDNVEIEDRYSDYKEIYFKVFQNGSIGMISTNLEYYIPVQFSNLIIYPKCYIGDGFIYSRNGQKLLPEKDYEIIEAETLVILKNISSNKYVVYNYMGNLLDSNIKQESDNIIEIKGRSSCYEYDIHNMILTKIESDISYPYGDDYPTDDDIKRGLMEAYNGDPEALWNTE